MDVPATAEKPRPRVPSSRAHLVANVRAAGGLLVSINGGSNAGARHSSFSWAFSVDGAGAHQQDLNGAWRSAFLIARLTIPEPSRHHRFENPQDRHVPWGRRAADLGFSHDRQSRSSPRAQEVMSLSTGLFGSSCGAALCCGSADGLVQDATLGILVVLRRLLPLVCSRRRHDWSSPRVHETLAGYKAPSRGCNDTDQPLPTTAAPRFVDVRGNL